MIDKNTSNVVNMLRWLSALLVLVAHSRYLILVNFKDVEIHKNIFLKGLYFVTGFGHEAVVLFFVISGFLVGGISMQRWSIKADYRKYLIDRFSRIYVVLVPALIVGAFFDYFGLNFFNGAELYTNSAKYHTNSLSSVISEKFTLMAFVGNLLMLQGKFTSTFGSNNPLWSLSYEWWYYMLFMLVYSFFKDNKKIWVVPIALIVMIVPVKTVIWGSIWVLGLMVIPVSRIMQGHKYAALVFGLLFLGVMFASRLSHNVDNAVNRESLFVEYLRDAVLGVGCALFLASICTIKREIPFSDLNQKLADFSYSTYLFHFPILIFAVSFLYQNFGVEFQRQPDVYGCIYFVGLSLVIYIFTYVAYLLFEKRTGVLRNRISKMAGLS